MFLPIILMKSCRHGVWLMAVFSKISARLFPNQLGQKMTSLARSLVNLSGMIWWSKRSIDPRLHLKINSKFSFDRLLNLLG